MFKLTLLRLRIGASQRQRGHLYDTIEPRPDAQLNRIEHKLNQLLRQGDNMSTDLNGVRAAVTALREAEEAQTNVINDLAGRIGNNPTPEELAQIENELRALTADENSKTAVLDGLDPDVAGGPISGGAADDEAPGVDDRGDGGAAGEDEPAPAEAADEEAAPSN